MERIVEQLKAFCNCLPDDIPDDIFVRNLTELINIISNLTCWAGDDCSTFLNSERSETEDIPCLDRCKCNGMIIEFCPMYDPFYPETLSVTLIEIDGIKETEIEISPEHFSYISSLCKIRVDLSEYIDTKCICCPPEYKIRYTYSAGYEEIPQCLLQLFCDLMHVMYFKNKCDCNICQACITDNDVTDEGEIEFTEGDIVTPTLDTYWKEIIVRGYMRNLEKISMCGKACNYRPFLGTVV